MTTRTDSRPDSLTYARIAGFTFIFYIAAGVAGMSLPDDAPVINVLGALLNLSALVLGVTLFMLTKEQGFALALLGMLCRVLEAVHDQSELFFAIGSLLFCWLLLRGRLIPAALAWLGVIASALLVVILPLQLAGVLAGAGWASSATWMIWMPMLVFELAISIWFFIKGVATPQTAETAHAN